MAFKEKAFAALVELEWFINEQVEEEQTARDIVYKFQLVKDDPAALLDLDREFGTRSARTGARQQQSRLGRARPRESASSVGIARSTDETLPFTAPNPPNRLISRNMNKQAVSIAHKAMIKSA